MSESSGESIRDRYYSKGEHDAAFEHALASLEGLGRDLAIQLTFREMDGKEIDDLRAKLAKAEQAFKDYCDLDKDALLRENATALKALRQIANSPKDYYANDKWAKGIAKAALKEMGEEP